MPARNTLIPEHAGIRSEPSAPKGELVARAVRLCFWTREPADEKTSQALHHSQSLNTLLFFDFPGISETARQAT